MLLIIDIGERKMEKKQVNKMSEENKDFALSCPVPISDYPNILLAHGGGGRLMNQLIEKIFMTAFSNSILDSRHDGAVFELKDKVNAKLAFTTDSYVVKPLFFKGGDIGTLAVNGTVNDIAMCGAKPLYISCGFIIEEGLSFKTLWKVVQSMRDAADLADVKIVTGDTKVVEKGSADKLYINTSGVGIFSHKININPKNIKDGDVIIINGDIGRHGIAVMAERENFSFDTKVESDCTPLSSLVLDLIDSGIIINCMRDLTRGGLASALVEIAESSSIKISIDEASLPVQEEVKGACEILGFDPIYVANEGKFIAFIPEKDVKRALEIYRSHPEGKEARVIGRVCEGNGRVVIKSLIGVERILDMLSGIQLPRIC